MNLFISKDPGYSILSSGIETVINLVWNEPVIANLAENINTIDSTDKPLIPATIGNFAFNFGGILELLIAGSEKDDPELWRVLVIAQDVLMGTYGLCMPIAGGIYAFAPNQTVN